MKYFLLFLLFTSNLVYSEPNPRYPVSKQESDELMFTYKPSEGDTYASLSDWFGTSEEYLKFSNQNKSIFYGGPILVPNKAPYKLKETSSPMTAEQFSSQYNYSLETIKELNRAKLRNSPKLNVFVIPELQTPWGLYGKFYQMGIPGLAFLAWPLLILGIASLGAGSFFGGKIGYHLLLNLKNKDQLAEKTEESATEKKEKIPSITIEILGGTRAGEKFTYEKNSIVIGRSIESDLSLDKDSLVSGKHFEIFLKEDGWFLKDLNSTNGTLIGNRKIFTHRIALDDIVELGFGGVKIKLTPYLPSQVKQFAGKGTTYIAAVVASSIKKTNKKLHYAIGGVTILTLAIGIYSLSLGARVSIAESRLDGHDKKLRDMGIQIEDMQKDMVEMKKSQEGIQGQFDAIRSKIASLSTQVDKNTRDIKTLQEEVEAIPKRMQAMIESAHDFSMRMMELHNAVRAKDKMKAQEILKKIEDDFPTMQKRATDVASSLENIERMKESQSDRDKPVFVDAVNLLHEGASKIHPVLGKATGILKSLVDNSIVIGLSSIARKLNLLGPFSVLL